MGLKKNLLVELKEYLLKLKKDINAQQNNENLSYEVIINEKLEIAAKKFFPEKGNWSPTCFKRPKEYLMRNLPCHLRDNEWLAKMLQIQCNLSYIDYKKILDFVNNSKAFNELRHNYELEIVRWQIDYMNHDGENWIVDESLGGDEFTWYSTCDIAFRKGIVDTLTAIGIHPDVIEEGIEKNVNMWRDAYMNLAFNREYNNDMLRYDIEDTNSEFKEKWLKMRRIEYYHDHKESVDKFGIVLPEMIMSEEEVAKLHTYLTKKGEERKKYIEECKTDPTKKRTLYLC